MTKLIFNQITFLGLTLGSFVIVDKFMFKYEPSDEDIAYQFKLEKQDEESYHLLQATIKYHKELDEKYFREEKEREALEEKLRLEEEGRLKKELEYYNSIKNQYAQLKQMIRDHECGVNNVVCNKYIKDGRFYGYDDFLTRTICYGNTSFLRANPKVDSVSMIKCEILLHEDVLKKIKIFESTDIYKKHKKNLDKYINTKYVYVDLIFNVGECGFKFKKRKDGTCTKEYTTLYKEALKDPFSQKSLDLVKSYNKAGGEELAGLTKRREFMVAQANLEKEKMIKSPKKNGLTVQEIFDVFIQ